MISVEIPARVTKLLLTKILDAPVALQLQTWFYLEARLNPPNKSRDFVKRFLPVPAKSLLSPAFIHEKEIRF